MHTEKHYGLGTAAHWYNNTLCQNTQYIIVSKRMVQTKITAVNYNIVPCHKDKLSVTRSSE